MSDDRSNRRDDYLWDRSGAPDPEVERLERVLRPLKYDRAAPVLPARAAAPTARRSWIFPLALAAALLLAGGGAWIAWQTLAGGGGGGGPPVTGAPAGRSWKMTMIAGAPTWAGAGAGGATEGRLDVGAWLETDAGSRALVEVADIGHVEVAPSSRLRLVETRPTEHRLELARGGIHAVVTAVPRLFLVDTPSATAIDLGCEYDLTVDASGASHLVVKTGAVELVGHGRSAWVPAGFQAETRSGRGPGTPSRPDSTEAFRRALAGLDFEGGLAGELDVALTEARASDAISLWHLLPRTAGEQRSRVYERLIELVASPPDVPRDQVLSLDPAAMETWRARLEGRMPERTCPPGTICGGPF